MNDTPRRAAPAPVGAKAAPAPAAPVEKPKAQSSLVPPVSLPPLTATPAATENDLLEEVARRICSIRGGRPDNFHCGQREWTHHVVDAQIQIELFQLLTDRLAPQEEANGGPAPAHAA